VPLPKIGGSEKLSYGTGCVKHADLSVTLMINTLESSGACANHSLPSHPMASRGHQASLTTVDDTYTLCSLPSLFLSFCANGSCFIEMTSKYPPFTPKRDDRVSNQLSTPPSTQRRPEASQIISFDIPSNSLLCRCRV